MLQCRHFPLIDGKLDSEEFNEFSKLHAPKQNDKQSGLIINPSGILFFYEDGELSVSEKIEPLRTQIRDRRHEILMAEPTIRQKEKETYEFKEKLLIAEEEYRKDSEHVEKKPEKNHERAIKNLREIIESNEAMIITQKGSQDIARTQIEALESVVADIEGGRI